MTHKPVAIILPRKLQSRFQFHVCGELLYSLIKLIMELRHLRYFVAVGEALSFTRGAEKLHLAQPSLTRQIKNLEEELGVRLLDRTKARVSLTPEVRSFLVDAKRVLDLSQEIV